MSGDNNDDVRIPMLFLFQKEGQALIEAWAEHSGLQVLMADKIMVFGKISCILTLCFCFFSDLEIEYLSNADINLLVHAS